MEKVKFGVYKKGALKNKNSGIDFTLNSEKILVVDDNIVNLSLMSAILKMFGTEVTTAKSGFECIELALKNTYGLIFIDHIMPEMDGVKTFEELLKIEGFKTPVIMVTSNDEEDEAYISKGFDGYISKPVSVDSIKEIILKFLKDKIVYKK